MRSSCALPGRSARLPPSCRQCRRFAVARPTSRCARVPQTLAVRGDDRPALAALAARARSHGDFSLPDDGDGARRACGGVDRSAHRQHVPRDEWSRTGTRAGTGGRTGSEEAGRRAARRGSARAPRERRWVTTRPQPGERGERHDRFLQPWWTNVQSQSGDALSVSGARRTAGDARANSRSTDGA